MSDKPKILIVDDESTNLDILVNMFEQDLTVLAATNGQEALSRAATARPDVILLDVQMPELDGYEVCKRLKAANETRHIPIIFITVLGNEESETRGLELGAVDYISKPFSRPIVRARVHNLLARQELHRQLDEMKYEFTAMIVHDLRSPLTVIGGFAELAKADDMTSEERRNALDRVIDNVNRARLLVDQMLDVSQLQAGRVRLNRKETDVSKLLREVARDHRILAGPKSISVIDEVAEGLQATVDPAKLTQVVTNLLGNALKYTPFQGRITVSGNNDAAGALLVSVTDTGPGVPPEMLGRIFAPWEHGPSPMRQTVKSYGLGLAISKMIVEAHGGRISVESRPGTPTRFSFRIPPA